MAEELEKLEGGLTLTDDFGFEEVDDFAEELLSKTKLDGIVTLEEAKKKEDAEKLEKEKAKLKVPAKKEISAEDLLEEEEPEEEIEEKEEDEDNHFETISRELVTLGVFSEDGELPKTGAEFAERFQSEKQKGASEWINNFLASEHGDEGIDIFKSIFVDKVDPREYFSVHNEILNLEELDLTNEINQKKVFREFYKELGWDDLKIEAKLQKSIDYSDLESDSKEYYEALLEKKEEKKKTLVEQKTQAEESSRQEKAAYKSTITKVLEEKLKLKDFDGIPLNPEKAKRVIDFLTTEKFQTSDKQKLTEYDKYMLESRKPENIRSRILTALLALDNFNFEGIKKRAVTTETDELFSDLKTKTKKTKQSKTQDWFTNNLN